MTTPSTRRSGASAATKLLLALGVVVVVLLGIWVTGGLITNDFVVAMVLTAGWMALAGAACAWIAWRRRDLLVPIGVAYLLTAAVVGVYLTRSTLLDDEVNEKVVTASPAQAAGAGAGSTGRPRNVLLARGRFESLAHPAEGVASTIRRARGGNVLTLTDFEVDNGPDLRVYLVAGPASSEDEVDDFEDVGALKGNKGDQQYRLPDSVDLDRYTTVVIWCRAFSVAFARAPLR